jgi:hypothetical protein
VSPKRKKLSAPASSRISTLAPSSVPMVSAPFRDVESLEIGDLAHESAAQIQKTQLLTTNSRH